MRLKKYACACLAGLLCIPFLAGCQKNYLAEATDGLLPIRDAGLYYKICGQGPPVVIVHGGPGFDHLHMLEFARLADEYQIIFYDQRATGYSVGMANKESITVENFVQDLEGLRKSFGYEQISLIGHSWGGMLALSYATQYPNHVKAMVLMGTAASIDFLDPYFNAIRQRTLPEDARRMQAIEKSSSFQRGEKKSFEAYYRLALKSIFADPAAVRKMNLAFGPNTYRNQRKVASLLKGDLGEFNFHDDMKNLDCPALIIHGANDPLPAEAAERIHQAIPDSELLIIEDAGHFMFVEKPNQVITRIRHFLMKQ